ncbi:MAG: tetratricopeptide repeat protein, partial [bacterium]
MGKIGAETLTNILNSFFTELGNCIYEQGGIIGKFGGDAMTIFFPYEPSHEKEIIQRGVTACVNLQRVARNHQKIQTPVGEFNLRIKIGISAGEVLFRVVTSQEERYEYLLAGEPLDRAAEAENQAQAGDLVVSEEVKKVLSIPAEHLGEGFYRLTIEHISSSVPLAQPRSIPVRPLAQKFIDPAVYRRLLLGLDSVGEIRLVTILFLSFEGLDYDGDPQVGEKLQEFYSWLSGIVHRYNGSINKMDFGDKGSKVLITFGAPEAQEKKEQLAVLCGLELVQSSALQSPSSQGPLTTLGIKCRAGIASGVAFAGEVGSPERQEYTVIGPVVNLAARLMSAAKTGDLLVDSSSYQSTKELFHFGPVQLLNLKGFKEPQEAYCALGIKSSPESRSGEIHLLDRKEELSQIHNVLAAVYERHKGEKGTSYPLDQVQTLIIRGSPGSGKTRLAMEMVHRARQMGFIIGAGEALSYAKRSPYVVWVSVLRGLFEISPSKGDRALQKLEQIIKECDPEHPFRLPIIANLLGISCPENDITRYFDASLRQENLYDFILHYFRYISSSKPVLVVFEDAQWIDLPSLELTAYILRNLPRAPILISLVRRPYSREFVTPFIKEIEAAPRGFFIEVKDFSIMWSEKLVRNFLRVDEVDESLMKFIYEASHGNPAFIIELVRHLQTSHLIALEPTERGLKAFPAGDLSQVEVPDSLTGLIMSQIDRLPAQTQLTMKLAAVVGRRFGKLLLLGSYPVPITEEEIRVTLNELQERDFIGEEIDADLLNYIFKNLLTREVAYESLLFAHRREYHKRVGLCLEALVQGREKEWCEDLARHFDQSDDDYRAAHYLLMAGDKAFDLYANEIAEIYYEKALQRTSPEKDPAMRFRALTMRAKVAAIVGKPEIQRQSLEEALLLTDVMNDLKSKVSTLDNLCQYYYRMNDPESLYRVTNEALDILNRIDHPHGWVTILSKVGAAKFMENRYAEALESWEKSSQLAEQIGDLRGLSMALTNCGLAYKMLGDSDKALEYYQRSITIDQQTGNLKSEAVNLGNLGILYHQRGEFDKALECYLRALELGRKIGSKEIQVRNMGSLAVIYQMRGQRGKARELLEQKLALEEMMAYRRGQVFTLGHLGEWFVQEGEFDLAEKYFSKALSLAEDMKLSAEVPWLIAGLGCLEHCRGRLDEAQNLLQKALDLSLQLKRKVEADYARRHLGLVLIEKEQWDEARVIFSELYQSAQSTQGKLGVAASKIGLGAIDFFLKEDVSLLHQGTKEAMEIGEPELVITGKL